MHTDFFSSRAAAAESAEPGAFSFPTVPDISAEKEEQTTGVVLSTRSTSRRDERGGRAQASVFKTGRAGRNEQSVELS
jgi:hypothetical protein